MTVLRAMLAYYVAGLTGSAGLEYRIDCLVIESALPADAAIGSVVQLRTVESAVGVSRTRFERGLFPFSTRPRSSSQLAQAAQVEETQAKAGLTEASPLLDWSWLPTWDRRAKQSDRALQWWTRGPSTALANGRAVPGALVRSQPTIRPAQANPHLKPLAVGSGPPVSSPRV
ncbi:hypothetical protein BX600DRAFT_430756 [Xylariales sp. PMI_506]|nr:hypothetical protein BX600DRAFT_430756 [Xylariales sp. PMI_506]